MPRTARENWPAASSPGCSSNYFARAAALVQGDTILVESETAHAGRRQKSRGAPETRVSAFKEDIVPVETFAVAAGRAAPPFARRRGRHEIERHVLEQVRDGQPVHS